ncbi:ATP-binding protein [Patescibacteria group bacterium AH-259-L05]|nr:ATP-binding protein [Patescibacteria group bacterium AH-259-L05]
MSENRERELNYKYSSLFELEETKRHQPWYRRPFLREKDSFSRAERKQIRKTITEQLDSSDEPWITIDGLAFPRPGYPFQVKEGTRYAFISSGSCVFVVETEITKKLFRDPETELEVYVVPLNAEAKLVEERRYKIRAQDIEPIPEEKIGEFIDKRQELPASQDIFFDGEAVELVEDITFKQESRMEGSAASQTLPKGLKGVIDSPQIRKGASLDEINSPYDEGNHEGKVTAELVISSGRKNYQIVEDRFVIPLPRQGLRYNVYVPDYRTWVEFTQAQLQRRSFDKEMFDRVVMTEENRKEILSLIFGKEEDLREWGIEDAFQKGRGLVFLAFGPPGTGKTMTGEALAEKLEKPLYIADSTALSYDLKSFEQGLKDMIKKTEQWGSVTLIDEADIILQSRDSGPFDSSARVAIVLRNLEKFERGVLWLTTNRLIDIDFAIDSRIRGKIHFPALDAEKRKKVWKITIPEKFPLAKELTDDDLDRLAEININGREITNAIMNAAKRASYDGLKKIPIDDLLASAQTICKNQEILDEVKEKGMGFQASEKTGKKTSKKTGKKTSKK